MIPPSEPAITGADPTEFIIRSSTGFFSVVYQSPASVQMSRKQVLRFAIKKVRKKGKIDFWGKSQWQT